MTAKSEISTEPALSCAEVRKPVKFPIKATTPQKKISPNPGGIDFPTLDELEMDVPILNEHMQQVRIAPEDESLFEVECLEHVMPSLGMTSLVL